MPNDAGLFTKEEVEALIKERVDRQAASHKIALDAVREELVKTRAQATEHAAAAAKLAELTAAQRKAERDAVWSGLGLAERAKLREALEAEYDAAPVEAGKDRPALGDWLKLQRETAGSLAHDLLGILPAAPAQPAATTTTQTQRPPPTTQPATPATPAAGDPAAAFIAHRAAAMSGMAKLDPAKRREAGAALIEQAKALAAGKTTV